MGTPLPDRTLLADDNRLPADSPEIGRRRFPAPSSARFAEEWTRVFDLLWRCHTRNREEQRCSLSELQFTDDEWAELLLWGGSVGGSAPAPRTLSGGVLFLAFSAAVARAQDSGQALWIAVRQQMSPAWGEVCFGSSSYPLEEARQSLIDTCERYGLRQQFSLSGTHRFWRTVLLQIGVQLVDNAGRLQVWLEGYSLPEHLATLLDDSDHNGSRSFRELWDCLRCVLHGEANAQTIARARSNCWFTRSLELHLTEIASRTSTIGTHRLRLEDQASRTALFSTPILRDRFFLLNPSPALPQPVVDALAQASATARLVIDGRTDAFVARPDGKIELRSGPFKLGRAQRTVEATVFQFGEVLYRETVELWREEDDLTFFDGRTGRPVEDLNRFAPVAGRAYTVLSPVDVRLSPLADYITSECEDWRFHYYATGLPPGLSASVDGFTIWSLMAPFKPQVSLAPGYLEIRSISAKELQLDYHGPPELRMRSARVAGRTWLVGATLTRSPELAQVDESVVPAQCFDGTQVRLRIRADRSGPVACWLSQREGGWREVDARRPLDGAELEDAILAISCDSSEGEDCWLTLGEQPLRAAADRIRLPRMPFCGEPLSLRFGLLYEERSPVPLTPAVYATGNLYRVTNTGNTVTIQLRLPTPRLSDYRVHVWERGRALPRVLNCNVVTVDPDGSRLTLPQNAVNTPLGWALSFERKWRGARFAIDPQPAKSSNAWDEIARCWLDIFAGRTEGPAARWDALAFSLRWWRFPLLLEPFRSALVACSVEQGAGTFRAWIRRDEGQDMRCEPLRHEPLTGLRELLRSYRPSGAEAAGLLAGLWLCPEGRFGPRPGVLYEKLEFLMDCDPPLFAYLFTQAVEHSAFEQLRAVKTVPVERSPWRAPDPAAEREIEQQRVAVLKDLQRTLAGLYGKAALDEPATNALREQAVSEFKSAGDPRALDRAYLENALLRPAEHAFLKPLTASEPLRMAIARSPALRACLVHHLIQYAALRRDA